MYLIVVLSAVKIEDSKCITQVYYQTHFPLYQLFLYPIITMVKLLNTVLVALYAIVASAVSVLSKSYRAMLRIKKR